MNSAELSEKSLICSVCKQKKSIECFYPEDLRCKLCQSLIKKKRYLQAKKTPKIKRTRKRCKNKIQNDLKNPDKFW